MNKVAQETNAERIVELANFWWESMDMKQIEEYVIDTLSDYYIKNPTDFEERWMEYKEIME
tara:strand:+ start:4541 stop:4723 length:183 start_codon:yes stop_codon:yes gene_type:complete